MSIALSGRELINLAINIERRGVAFYDIMCRSTGNAAAKVLFQHLTTMERKHIDTFQAMLGEADGYLPPKNRISKSTDYLQALADSAVFTDDLMVSEMATRAESDIAAVELATVAEKDSILFYYEMRAILPEPARPTIDKIMAERKGTSGTANGD